MITAHCKFCKKIIIKDWGKFLKTCKENYIQCPYCKRIYKLEGVILKKWEKE